MKLLFLTGSRGEWGYIKPILEICKLDKKLNYSICVTNMHLLSNYGETVNEIEKDGFQVDHKIYMAIDGYNHISMTKSLGVLLSSLADIFLNSKPDWIILAGDRGEQLIGAVAGAFSYIPIAHIQAGEISGNIDGMSRHAIGKFAHLHFASNNDAAIRLSKLGESKFRIFNVGAPQIDDMLTIKRKQINFYIKSLGINRKFMLVVLHPNTEEFYKAQKHTEIFFNAIITANDFNLI